MESLIILSLILAIFQLWLIPMILNIKNLNWMIGNRESPIPETPLVARAKRAGSNLQESLPIFFACAVLSIVMEVDSLPYALSWLILRIIYFLCYAYKLNPYRSIVWMGSIICLILMAINLI